MAEVRPAGGILRRVTSAAGISCSRIRTGGRRDPPPALEQLQRDPDGARRAGRAAGWPENVRRGSGCGIIRAEALSAAIRPPERLQRDPDGRPPGSSASTGTAEAGSGWPQIHRGGDQAGGILRRVTSAAGISCSRIRTGGRRHWNS